MSYAKRRIDLTIKNSNGAFNGTGSDTVTLSGLRIQANVAAHGGDVQGVAQIRVYGLPLDQMNQLMRIGTIGNEKARNSVLLAAGDSDAALTTVFKGTISQAWADFQSGPDVALNIISFSAYDAALNPVGASSYKGAVDAAQIMSDLAKLMQLGFENNGVSVILSNPYFPGTLLTQSDLCAQAADIRYTIERGVMSIWKKGDSRSGEVPLISPDTGMVGYPIFSDSGVVVTSIFVPNIRNGGNIDLESSLAPANGRWNVRGVVHSLESEAPNGAWFTQMACGRPTNG